MLFNVLRLQKRCACVLAGLRIVVVVVAVVVVVVVAAVVVVVVVILVVVAPSEHVSLSSDLNYARQCLNTTPTLQHAVANRSVQISISEDAVMKQSS